MNLENTIAVGEVERSAGKRPGSSCDVAIIGGGHNALVCACYLARSRLDVLVLEAQDVVGGCAVTEEFYPGFRNSVASYTVSLLHPKIIDDLRLREHGLRLLRRPLGNFLPLSDDESLSLGGGLATTQAEFARFSKRDAQRLPAYYDMLSRVTHTLRSLLLTTPPTGAGGIADIVNLLSAGKRLRSLERETRQDLLDLFSLSAAELLERWFESEPVRAAFAFDATVGNFASPHAAGTAYVLLHHVFGEVNGHRGEWGHAVGGMGAITQAMAADARIRGVRIRTGAAVARVTTDGGRTTGVELTNGEVIASRCVAASVNPKLLYQQLVDAADLDDEFRRRIANYRCGSATLRMNVALGELPDFRCKPGTELRQHHQAGIVIAPSIEYMDRAYVDARTRGMAREPIVEVLIPSTVDDTLAPAGHHVASLFCQHFNPRLPEGASWDDRREAAADLVIETVNAYAPNFSASVLGRQTLTPLDLERRFGLVGGDIFHGALSLNQLYGARPLLGYGSYRGPIAGLYHCGSGAHPGGGVTGIPGHNAAREIAKDLRSARQRLAALIKRN
ncbi:MAG: phytoene desaturase family protein [Gammaproteobacteria bacterium]